MTMLLHTRRTPWRQTGGARSGGTPRPAVTSGPVISTFLHQGRFAIVTNARFVPGPGNRVKTGAFAFDQCWTGIAWGELIATAMIFDTRDKAQDYLTQHQERLRTSLPDHTCWEHN